MNNEERQYWINILPIMTPEQLKNLEDILANEKKQLSAIDEKYSKDVAGVGDEKVIAQMEQNIKQKRKKREDQEKRHQEQESQSGDALLEQIEKF